MTVVVGGDIMEIDDLLDLILLGFDPLGDACMGGELSGLAYPTEYWYGCD